MRNIKSLGIWILTGLFIVPTAFAVQGLAELKGTADGSSITGTVVFTEVEGGVNVNANVAGVQPAGKRGFHIHEFGSCADTGKSAGGHYNPTQSEHGLVSADGHAKAHAGDLGNIEIKDDGTGALQGFLPGVKLTNGEHEIAGRAVILHEKEDDFGQPTGNAGGRVACGPIIITAP